MNDATTTLTRAEMHAGLMQRDGGLPSLRDPGALETRCEDEPTTGLHATATWRAVSCGDMVTACRSRCSPRWAKENGVSCCDRRLVS